MSLFLLTLFWRAMACEDELWHGTVMVELRTDKLTEGCFR